MKKKILLLHLDVHYDFQEIKKLFRKQGIEVDEFHLLNDNLLEINHTEYGLMDLRNCRGFQDIQSTFREKLLQIDEFATKYNIKVIAPLEMLPWLYEKSVYLKDLESSGVKINPTKFIETNRKGYFDLSKHVDERPYGVMIKPSAGARAWNVYRVRKSAKGKGFYDIIHSCQASIEKSFSVNIGLKSRNEINGFFDNYSGKYSGVILVQDYIPSREYCAVFLGNKFSHLIEKIADEKSEKKGLGIRHDLYGASIKYVPNPRKEIIDFATDIVERKPSVFKNQKLPYFRLDIFENVAEEERHKTLMERLTLNELEVMTVHLYLLESGKVGNYVNAMKNILQSSSLERKEPAVL